MTAHTVDSIWKWYFFLIQYQISINVTGFWCSIWIESSIVELRFQSNKLTQNRNLLVSSCGVRYELNVIFFRSLLKFYLNVKYWFLWFIYVLFDRGPFWRAVPRYLSRALTLSLAISHLSLCLFLSRSIRYFLSKVIRLTK